MKQVFWLLSIMFTGTLIAQTRGEIKVVNVAQAWANNSVNAVIFRKNSLVTYRDTQFIAYYNQDKFVVLGKRKAGTGDWILKQTPFQGNANDAHNSISIMVDGEGFLHMSWDHHGHSLRYAKSLSPGSLELTKKIPMIGTGENQVTYPEFYKMPSGDLLFFYRSGSSGQGDLVLNKYDVNTKTWKRLHNNLINGESARNAYWQAYIDHKGTIHISWVWRESPNVASNHDLGYACSKDGGLTWQKSTGERYVIPITQSTSEYAFKIPQNSELINQTSMSADKAGNPFIATYWRESGSNIPQYHIVYNTGKKWQVMNLDFRTTAFSLSGAGTKRIPISRPQIMVSNARSKPSGLLVFRDEERGSKVSVVTIKNFKKNKWSVSDLTNTSAGSWEPSFDTELWSRKRTLNLFLQNVQQVDAEGKANIPPQMVQVLEWKPNF
ncbi:MAG: BNR-4 repeat-containing protein [Sphingobacteriaceae bacterium]|nr:BNR-4 repeat-containing protein [Sphingobacteriaceae bacterium]